MSLKYEQYRSLYTTQKFLFEILSRPHSSWTAKELKEKASRCVRHYPVLKANGEPIFSQDKFDCPKIKE
jgi:hypothetical protein